MPSENACRTSASCASKIISQITLLRISLALTLVLHDPRFERLWTHASRAEKVGWSGGGCPLFLSNTCLLPLRGRGRFLAMIKAEILEALPKLSAEERQEIRAKLNELDNEAWFDNGELSEQEKAIIEARLDEYDRDPEAGSSWEEAKARVLAGLHAK
jgi:putative addiction module component (TIGR02574 family)